VVESTDADEQAVVTRAIAIAVVIHRMAGTLPVIPPYDSGYAVPMSNSRTGVATIDPNDPRGAEVIGRLRNDRISWLTTVAADGTPQTSPIWFLWNGDEIFLYSLESARARNVANHPRVSLHLDGNGMGGDIVVIEGTASIDDQAPSCADNPEYLAKYGPVMEANGWFPEWFAERYSVPVRIAVTKYRYW
jgi:PPOX class probable F420-dependent enzyme